MKTNKLVKRDMPETFKKIHTDVAREEWKTDPETKTETETDKDTHK